MDRRDGWIAHATIYLKDESRDGDGGSQRDERSIDQACREHVISCLMDLIRAAFLWSFSSLNISVCSVLVLVN